MKNRTLPQRLQPLNFVRPLYKKTISKSKINKLSHNPVITNFESSSKRDGVPSNTKSKTRLKKRNSVSINIRSYKRNQINNIDLPGTCAGDAGESEIVQKETKLCLSIKEPSGSIRTKRRDELMESLNLKNGNVDDPEMGDIKNDYFCSHRANVKSAHEQIKTNERWLRVIPAQILPREGTCSVLIRCFFCQVGLAAFLSVWTLIWIFIIHSLEVADVIMALVTTVVTSIQPTVGQREGLKTRPFNLKGKKKCGRYASAVGARSTKTTGGDPKEAISERDRTSNGDETGYCWKYPAISERRGARRFPNIFPDIRDGRSIVGGLLRIIRDLSRSLFRCPSPFETCIIAQKPLPPPLSQWYETNRIRNTNFVNSAPAPLNKNYKQAGRKSDDHSRHIGELQASSLYFLCFLSVSLF
ncbi:hypothetical protein EVAR_62187_1 [Eumeta japonica]|uniref:Uncharacterized protein n=1 Tax=Eumeta variegata TaxID=151549 RepID=A0A4C1Z4X7_EUMVA|nr:hypothetical protein EVAR_62187_1 [Eumeta japonica]